jgi:hypothetical protein
MYIDDSKEVTVPLYNDVDVAGKIIYNLRILNILGYKS